MAINNPFEITYGSRAVGGASDIYQLNGPYVFEKSFTTLRVAFDVVVVGTTYATLQNYADTLETDFRKRDLTLKIDLDAVADQGGASTWTYTFGTDILNTVATLTKTGDPDTDRGFSRAYTCVIEGELPADDDTTGLRELQWNVRYEAGRQRIITMQGVYTALSGTGATAKYQNVAGADAEALTFLTALSGSATYELEHEEYEPDRNDHTCAFTRQYVELLISQTTAALVAGIDTATDIRDHRVTFTQQFTQPGDSAPDLYRLRRMLATYDCAVDIDNTTDLQSVYADQIKPHIKALFEDTFSPQVFCIEDTRVAYDETAKRVSVALTFLYQAAGGGEFVEVTSSLTTKEARTLDPTYVHDGGEFSAYVDIGWGAKTRTITRTAIVLGEDVSTKGRITGESTGGGGQPQEGNDPRNIFRIPTGGGGKWWVIDDTANVTQHWLGDPEDEQIFYSILNETVVMQWFEQPRTGGGGGTTVTRVPITGNLPTPR